MGSPLLTATIRGHIEVVKLLLDNGAYIEATDTSDQTPLSLASEKGDVAIVRLLVERDAYSETGRQDSRPDTTVVGRQEVVMRPSCDCSWIGTRILRR